MANLSTALFDLLDANSDASLQVHELCAGLHRLGLGASAEHDACGVDRSHACHGCG